MEGKYHQMNMGEVLKGKSADEKGPDKRYYFEDMDSSRGLDGERGTFSVCYDEERGSYTKDGRPINFNEARDLLENHPKLDDRDRKRLESIEKN